MSSSTLHQRVKEMIIERLQLEGMNPEDIDDRAALFGDGLGLDSIDALELVIGIEKTFGVRIEDEDVGTKAFASVDALVEYLRGKGADAAS
jgi:acyl carrier protein